MRPRADAERIHAFVRELGRVARSPARLYLTGGATAVLEGWRGTTVDIDVHLEPDTDELLFDRIEPELYRFPAIDPASFRTRVERELA